MAVYTDLPSCRKEKGYNLYSHIYIMFFIAMMVVGILYETGVIQKTDYEEDSVWWQGLIILAVGAFLVLLVHALCNSNGLKLNQKDWFWSGTHLMLYTLLGYLAPGQWPFWVAAGILWEYTECYTLCWDKSRLLKMLPMKIKVGCNGYHDIITNIAGLAVGIIIKSRTLKIK